MKKVETVLTMSWIKLPYSDWFLFLVFLVANFALSYLAVTLETKLWIGLLGLAFPMAGFLAFKSPRSKPLALEKSQILPALPVWAWLLLGSLALAFRFYHITTLSVWPHYDEGIYGYYAFKLNEHWTGRLFYGVSRVPPLYIWGLALFFKAFGVSLQSLWSFPALISLAAVPLTYAASRQYFSNSLSFCMVVFMALGFWPVFLGRFSFMTSLILMWEVLIFWLLGRALNSRLPLDRKRNGALLGGATGLGFWIHIHWPIVAIGVVLTLVFAWLKPGNKEKEVGPFFWFLAPCALLGFPLVFMALKEGYGRYLLHLLPQGNFFSYGQWAVSLSYIGALFWGMDSQFHTYQPFWGGFLNPITSSLFLLGLIQAFQNRNRPLEKWLLWALVLFLLPAILTREREAFRAVPVLPVLFAVAALGLSSLWQKRGTRSGLWLMLLLSASALLDFHHLQVYHQAWKSPDTWRGYFKSVERYRAYGLCQKLEIERGPGLLFSDFVQGLSDQTFRVAVYGFNAADNPSLDFSKARWAGLLTNIHYQPFLSRRFPGGQAFPLDADSPPPDGGWMLWVMPVTPQNLPDLRLFQTAQSSLVPFLDANISYFEGEPFDSILGILEKNQPLWEKDPFLRSSFFEKTSDLRIKAALAEAHGEKPDLSAAIGDLNQALSGYPAGHLYQHLGMLYWIEGQTAEAQKAFARYKDFP